MCLLIVMFQAVPGAPLIVAANRDEQLHRPAVPMTVLREHGPRVLGGRDELAGGTWLAVNEHGLVAALTNQPSPDGRDPAKRSRGELPLAFARYPDAERAVEAVTADLDPASYNPCWMLVGDRRALFSIGLAGGGKPEVERLGPGVHILENAPLRAGSAKQRFVRRLVGEALTAEPDDGIVSTLAALESVLRDHQPSVPEPRLDSSGRQWPPAISAACVHVPGHGTRCATTVTIGETGLPGVRVADGPPCQAAFQDASGLWAAVPSAGLAG